MAVTHQCLSGKLYSITSQTGDCDPQLVKTLEKDSSSLEDVCYISYERALQLVDEFLLENSKFSCEDLQTKCLKQLIEYCDDKLMQGLLLFL